MKIVTSKMSNIEEKILDGPRIHYCEADNDDIRVEKDEGQGEEDELSVHRDTNTSLFTKPDEEMERLNRASHVRWLTGSTNTGPKGVIEDYKKKKIQAKVKELTSKENKNDDIDALEAEFQELLNDETILKEFITKRINSSTQQAASATFGQVFRLQTGGQLLDAIDNENPNILVIVHIYTKYSRSCSNLNRCLVNLADEFKHVKFVTLDAGVTALSGNFKENGVPALLAYKGGELVKSLVQLDEWLDRDFGPEQVRELLVDNGLV